MTSPTLETFHHVSFLRLDSFIRESFMIEGIYDGDYNAREQLDAAEEFLTRDLSMGSLLLLLSHVQKDARLRNKSGMDVWIGSHTPPCGGSGIQPALCMILHDAKSPLANPYLIHQSFEALHPFSDGNGRTGRMLWLWDMIRSPIYYDLRRLFLHQWYYQSLDIGRG